MNAAAVTSIREGHELHDLLAPLSVEAFLREYWGRKPLYLQGDGAKFRGLFDRAHFHRALAQSQRVLVHASYDRGRTEFEIKPDEVDEVYAKGATVCAAYLEEGSPELLRLCEAVRRQLNHVGLIDVRAYLSPDGTGFDTHYDARIATTLQIEGRKRWRYSTSPSMPWPSRNRLGFESMDDADRGFEEVTLEPGDVLCLPAGTWHSAKAEGHSLALNMAINPIGFVYLAMEHLQPRLRQEAFWREPIPTPGPLAPRSGADAIPEEVKAYLASRFSQLAVAFDEMSRSDSALQEFWYLGLLSARRRDVFGARSRPGTLKPPDAEPAAPSGGEVALHQRDVVRLKANVDAYHMVREDDDGGVVVYYGPPTRKLSLPTRCHPLIEKLISGRSFTVRTARKWLGNAAQAQVEQLLQRLISGGLIEIRRLGASPPATPSPD